MFKLIDLACRCCDKIGRRQSAKKLLKVLNRFQKFLGYKYQLTLNSACRCRKHNKDVGGVDNPKTGRLSFHVKCLAVDLIATFLNSKELKKKAEEFGEWDGIGIYNTFVHCDIRGYRVRFDKRSKK